MSIIYNVKIKTSDNSAKPRSFTEIKNEIFSDLANLITESSRFNFPITHQIFESEKKRLCTPFLSKPANNSDHHISYQPTIAFFAKENFVLKKIELPDSTNCLESVIYENHKYLSSIFQEFSLTDVFEDPERLFCLTVNEYIEKKTDVGTSSVVLHGFSATGRALQDLIVLGKGPISKRVFPKRKFHYRFSEDGNLTASIFNDYLSKIFIPFISENKIQVPVILFIDNLRLFINSDTIKLCKNQNIILVSILPYGFTSNSSPIGSIYCKPIVDSYNLECEICSSSDNEFTNMAFPKFFADSLGKLEVKTDLKLMAKQTFKDLGLYPWTKDNIDIAFLKGLSGTIPTLSYILETKSKSHNLSIFHLYGVVQTIQSNKVISKTKDLAKMSEFVQKKKNLFIGNWILDVYNNIVEQTLAGIFVNVSISSNFYTVYPDIKTTYKMLLKDDGDRPTYNQLIRWHKNCTNFLKQKKIFEIVQNPSRVACFDTTVFNLYDDGMVSLSENESLEEAKVIVGHTIFGDGRSFHECFTTSRSYQKILKKEITIIQPSIVLEVSIKEIYRSLKAQNIEFPVILFINPYKYLIQLPTIKFCKEVGIILIGSYPHPVYNFNPVKMLFFDLQQKAIYAHGLNVPNETKFLLKLQPQAMIDVMVKLTIPDKVCNAFRSFGFYPWSSENIDKTNSFAKCGFYKFQNHLVTYKAKNKDDESIPCSLHIGSSSVSNSTTVNFVQETVVKNEIELNETSRPGTSYAVAIKKESDFNDTENAASEQEFIVIDFENSSASQNQNNMKTYDPNCESLIYSNTEIVIKEEPTFEEFVTEEYPRGEEIPIKEELILEEYEESFIIKEEPQFEENNIEELDQNTTQPLVHYSELVDSEFSEKSANHHTLTEGKRPVNDSDEIELKKDKRRKQ